MKALLATVFILIASAGTAQAQGLPNSTARSSYVSVMSKAGTPTPRPSVPNRTVGLPAGAGAGYNYYYGYRYGYGGSAAPSYANEPAPFTSSSLPGYDTRPRSSRSRDSLTNRGRRR